MPEHAKPHTLVNFKLPYKEDRGFIFNVLECNVIEGDEVMGRAFIPAEQAKRMMEHESSCLLSIGQNIGCIKVKVYRKFALYYNIRWCPFYNYE